MLKTFGKFEFEGYQFQTSTLLWLTYINIEENVSKQEVMERVWPTSDDPSRALRERIRNLNKRERLVEQDGNMLQSTFDSDVKNLKQLIEQGQIKRALEVHKGPFLKDIEKSHKIWKAWILERRRGYAKDLTYALLELIKNTREGFFFPKKRQVKKKQLINYSKKLVELTKLATKFNKEEITNLDKIQILKLVQEVQFVLEEVNKQLIPEIKAIPIQLGIEIIPQLHTEQPLQPEKDTLSETTSSQTLPINSLVWLWTAVALMLTVVWSSIFFFERSGPSIFPLSQKLQGMPTHIAAFWGSILTGIICLLLFLLTKSYEKYVKNKHWYEMIPFPFGSDLNQKDKRYLAIFLLLFFFFMPIYVQGHFTRRFLIQEGPIIYAVLNSDGDVEKFEEVPPPSYCGSKQWCAKLFEFYSPSVILGYQYFYGDSNYKVTYWPFWGPWLIIFMDSLLLWLLVRLIVVQGFFKTLSLPFKKGS